MSEDVLKNFALFATLDRSTRDLVYAGMESVIIKAGNYLFREGDASEGMYFLVKGECEVRKNDDDHDIPVACIKHGRVFGEMSVMSTGQRSASVFFHKEAHLLLWPKERFLSFLKEYPSAGVVILTKLCEVIARRMVVRDEELRGQSGTPSSSGSSGGGAGELTTFRRKLANDWSI